MKKKLKRRTSVTQLIERFHDNNRYFLPLIFVSMILMLTGINYLGPLTVTTELNFNRTYLFDGTAYVIAVPLMEGWAFQADILTNKAVSLSITNLNDELIATSNDPTTIKFVAPVFDTYFLRLTGSDYALLELTYMRAGYGPYPIDYSLFCSGLIVLLLTIIYSLIKPLKFSFKKALDSVDALFYPIVIICSSVVFWVFINSSIWFYASDFLASLTIKLICSAVILAGSCILLKSKLKPLNSFIVGYAVSFFTVYLLLMIKFTTINLIDLIIFLALIGLGAVYYFSKERVVVLYFLLAWLVSSIIKFGVYVVGLPLQFGLMLAMPVSWALTPTLVIIELFMAFACYFLVRAYYSKDVKQGLEYGLYSGVFIQGFFQLMLVTSIML